MMSGGLLGLGLFHLGSGGGLRPLGLRVGIGLVRLDGLGRLGMKAEGSWALGAEPPVAPIIPPSFALSRLERRLDKAKEGGGAKTTGGHQGWGLKEPAGTVEFWCGASAGRGPEDFKRSSDRCNLDAGRVGHGVSLGPGACWPRLPMWPGSMGQTCGALVLGLPAADSLRQLRSKGCLRQACCSSTAQGCLRQAYGTG